MFFKRIVAFGLLCVSSYTYAASPAELSKNDSGKNGKLDIGNQVERDPGSRAYYDMYEVAKQYLKYGQFELARQSYQKLIDVVPKGSHFYAKLHQGLARSFMGLELFSRAEENFRIGYEITKEVRGEGHIDTFMAYKTIAESLKAQGRYSEAEEIYVFVLRDLVADASAEYAIVCNDYASNLNAMGRYEEALKYYKISLDVRRFRLGEKHILTAKSYNGVGFNLSDMGRYEEAEEPYLKGMVLRQELLGEDHYVTAESYNNLGYNYADLKNYERAVHFLRLALDSKVKSLGKYHPDTIRSHQSLARVYADQGDNKSAESLYKKAISLSKEMRYQDFKLEAESYRRLSNFYAGNELYKLAVDYRLKSAETAGDKNSDSAVDYYNVAFFYEKLGDELKAEEFYIRSLNVRVSLLGMDNPDTADSYNTLGVFYHRQGRRDEALEMYLISLGAHERYFGRGHLKTANLLRNIAYVHFEEKNYSKAKNLFLEVVNFLEGQPEKGKDLASSYLGYARLLEAMGFWRESGEAYQKTVPFESVISQEELEVFYAGVGRSLHRERRYMEAEVFLLKWLSIYKEIYGARNDGVGLISNKVAVNYKRMGDIDRAEKFFSDAYIFFSARYDEDHPYVRGAKINLKMLHQ